MKKLAYIILVIAILVVISHFVKQGNLGNPAVETVTVTEEIAPVEEINNENVAPAEDNDVVDVQEDIIIDDAVPTEEVEAVEVEETNPSETADEDETIIQE